MTARQGRARHSEARTTMRYSHTVSEEGRRFTARLIALLMPEIPVVTTGRLIFVPQLALKLSEEKAASDWRVGCRGWI